MSENYLLQFQNLNVNKTGNRLAPHKPILLLSVMDLIETRAIKTRYIPISDELERAFKANWDRYVPNSIKHNCGMCYPFYHLSSSSFWHLIKTQEYENKAPTSMKALKRSYRGAEIDHELFEAMQDQEMRQQLRDVLINTYLSEQKAKPSASILKVFAMIGMMDLFVLNA